MDIARDEVGVSSENTLPPEEAAQLIARITAAPLEIPNFDRSWHPNEITAWLGDIENDENLSDADLTRARRAVSDALGVDA